MDLKVDNIYSIFIEYANTVWSLWTPNNCKNLNRAELQYHTQYHDPIVLMISHGPNSWLTSITNFMVYPRDMSSILNVRKALYFHSKPKNVHVTAVEPNVVLTLGCWFSCPCVCLWNGLNKAITCDFLCLTKQKLVTQSKGVKKKNLLISIFCLSGKEKRKWLLCSLSITGWYNKSRSTMRGLHQTTPCILYQLLRELQE